MCTLWYMLNGLQLQFKTFDFLRFPSSTTGPQLSSYKVSLIVWLNLYQQKICRLKIRFFVCFCFCSFICFVFCFVFCCFLTLSVLSLSLQLDGAFPSWLKKSRSELAFTWKGVQRNVFYFKFVFVFFFLREISLSVFYQVCFLFFCGTLISVSLQALDSSHYTINLGFISQTFFNWTIRTALIEMNKK